MWLEKATRGSTSFKSLSIVISHSGTTRKERVHVANSTILINKKIVHSTICCIESTGKLARWAFGGHFCWLETPLSLSLKVTKTAPAHGAQGVRGRNRSHRKRHLLHLGLEACSLRWGMPWRKGRVEEEAGDYEPSLASALSGGTEASSDDGDWAPPGPSSRDISPSLSGRSPGLTPAGEPRMSGRAFLLPDRPEVAKSNTGSTSVISAHQARFAVEQKEAQK